MVQGLQQGTVDIGVSGTAYFSGLNAEIEVFQLPFLFEDLETARKATSGAAAEKTCRYGAVWCRRTFLLGERLP